MQAESGIGEGRGRSGWRRADHTVARCTQDYLRPRAEKDDKTPQKVVDCRDTASRMAVFDTPMFVNACALYRWGHRVRGRFRGRYSVLGIE